MKLLIVSKTFLPYSHHRKLEEIAKLGVDLYLVTPTEWAGVKLGVNPAQVKNYRIIVLPVVFEGFQQIYFYPVNVEKYLKDISPDIIFLHEEPYTIATYQWLKGAKKLQIPVLFLTDQNIFKKYPWPFSYLEKFSFANSAAGAVINAEGIEILRRKGFHKPLRKIVEVGIDPDEFCRQDGNKLREELNLSGCFVVGYVGRLVWEKGLDLLLAAAKFLVKEKNIIRLRFLFIGSGPEKKNIQRFARRNQLNEYLRVLDYIDSQYLPEYLNLFDCLVLPSRQYRGKILFWKGWKEQFGRVLVEAMACKVAVIGSSSGEIPRVIGDAGLIFPENDWQTLAGQIERLINNPELRRDLGEKGRQRVLQNYTARVAARQLVDFCQEILDENSH